MMEKIEFVKWMEEGDGFRKKMVKGRRQLERMWFDVEYRGKKMAGGRGWLEEKMIGWRKKMGRRI